MTRQVKSVHNNDDLQGIALDQKILATDNEKYPNSAMGKTPFHLKIISGQGLPARSIEAEDSALKNAKYILAVSREAVSLTKGNYRTDSANQIQSKEVILPELNRGGA